MSKNFDVAVLHYLKHFNYEQNCDCTGEQLLSLSKYFEYDAVAVALHIAISKELYRKYSIDPVTSKRLASVIAVTVTQIGSDQYTDEDILEMSRSYIKSCFNDVLASSYIYLIEIHSNIFLRTLRGFTVRFSSIPDFSKSLIVQEAV